MLSTYPLFSQSKKIDKNIGFGGPSFVNTTLAGEWTMETGGLGGGFINKQFYIGGGGFGLSQRKNNYEYDMGYGGLMLGYFWKGGEKIALNFYLLGGYGGIEESGENIKKNKDGFWAVRPAVEVDFLLTDWLRLGIGGGYRWISEADILTLDNDDLSASFGSITFRFGNWKN
jgi:hypothetical protein